MSILHEDVVLRQRERETEEDILRDCFILVRPHPRKRSWSQPCRDPEPPIGSTSDVAHMEEIEGRWGPSPSVLLFPEIYLGRKQMWHVFGLMICAILSQRDSCKQVRISTACRSSDDGKRSRWWGDTRFIIRKVCALGLRS